MDQDPARNQPKNGTLYQPMQASGGEPSNQPPQQPRFDLAEHFLECGKLGRYLTVADESRFVITDDFHNAIKLPSIATAAASVFSRDILVAQSALVPLGLRANRLAHAAINTAERQVIGRYEELFSLIESTAFSPEVRNSAEAIMRAGFNETRIREIERELGNTISPARLRYGKFLEIVRDLINKRLSIMDFREEFLEFTRDVAGKLDFGIYSFCLDRIFMNTEIPLNAKGSLIAEILLFPNIIRREIITNVLSSPHNNKELTEFVRILIEQELDQEAVVQIYLLVTLKSSRLSIRDVESMFLQNPAA